MTEQVIIKGKDLAQMDVESLLSLSISSVELLADLPTLPSGFYEFVVDSADLDTVGKEDKQAIVVALDLTSVAELENPNDAAMLEGLEFPREFKTNFSLEAKNGYGLRAFVTFAHGYAVEQGLTSAMDIIAKLPGATGVVHIVAESWIPEGKTKEEARMRNRMREADTIWK